ncbi:MAG TPA: LamG domain-containing protein, partial [Candidatus Paceibacterota bacterium]
LGPIIKPQSTSHNMGGVPILIVGSYVHVYFDDSSSDDTTRRPTVARALLSDVLADCDAGKADASHWKKYSGGAFTGDAFTSLGDRIISETATLNAEWDIHADAAYVAPLGKYMLLILNSWHTQLNPRSTLFYTLSTDGVNWEPLTVVDDASAAFPVDLHYYSTIVGLGTASDDSNTVGDDFYILYPRIDHTDFDPIDFYRRRLTVPTSGAHDGTLVNAPSWVSGQVGNALSFPGVNQYVSVPSAVVTDVPITMAAWIRIAAPLNSTATILGVFKNGATNREGHRILVDESANIVYAQSFSDALSGGGGFAQCNINLSIGTWYRVLATFNNSSLRKIYINGNLCGTNTATVTTPGTNITQIGAAREQSSPVNFFSGGIDEAVIWHRVLSDAEIAADGNQAPPVSVGILTITPN